MRYSRAAAGLALLVLTAACGHNPNAPAPKPPYAGIKLGKPYEIYGRWYEPKYNEHYDEIGVASWYGPGFHGGKTANGDRFDQDEMTAAHRTLPLPSIVRVTNLDTGQSALVKVNDRGPFSHDRIIDLSKAAAKKIGVWRTGTAKVRVQFLDAETRAYVQNLENGSSIEYAMDQVSQTNPDEAIARQEAGEKPQLAIGSRMFGKDNSPELVASDATVTPVIETAEEPATYTPAPTLTTVQTDPIPPAVHVLREPPAQPQPALKPLPPPAYPPSMQQQQSQQVTQNTTPYTSDPFSVVDNSPRLTPVENPAAQAQMLSSPQRARLSASHAISHPAFHAPVDGTAGGEFYIQAGTFGMEANARKLSGKLSSAGEAKVTQITLSGKKYYRVTLGPYNRQDDARNMLSNVTALGIPDARITRN